MQNNARAAVVIPALNEERSIGLTLRALPPGCAAETIVVDNGSVDRTADEAARHGARVIRENRRGYGSACLAGINALSDDIQIVAFLDADYSDDPSELPRLLQPILDGEAEMTIGSRTLGEREQGALTPHARFGNWLATRLIRLLWGVRFTDLGPFRAIRRDALERMQMRDTAHGWTVEMQVKAAILKTPFVELPAAYRRRVGQSKISGTWIGSARAGFKILSMIAYYWIVQRRFKRNSGA